MIWRKGCRDFLFGYARHQARLFIMFPDLIERLFKKLPIMISGRS
ncbi:hypothetical protein KOEU_01740 [Komagataeibacter europaeus]|uniref:Uncharacterized protein n=1 Tax=Komagataeibacter europaeus TaxID=33995 RepID=A0A0M0EMP5_KOMEU|nr:hypothetical protein KOEU_01740 [Komagataeibacter europaeus]